MENVGNFCENASRFTRVIGNYVYNAHTLTFCAIRSPEEFTGLTQAIVADNIFEGGRQNRGLGISGDEVIISNNTFSGFSKATAVDIGGNKVVLNGNIIDLTQDSFCPDHWRDGVQISGNNVIVSNTHIGMRSAKGRNKTCGIAITECAKNLLIHDNMFQSLSCGIRSGTRMAQRVYENDPTSSSWDRPWEDLTVKITEFSPEGKIKGLIPEYLLSPAKLSGKWIITDDKENEIELSSPITLLPPVTVEFTAEKGVFTAGKSYRIYPEKFNWKLHDNMFMDCDKDMDISLPAERGITIRD